MEGEVVLLNAGLQLSDLEVADTAGGRRVAPVPAVVDILAGARCLTLPLIHWKIVL